ncbi:hypothetical protein D3C84_237090 [compost metagenome]
MLVEARLFAIEVEQQRPGDDGRLGETAGAAQQGVQARVELFELERLDHVIVGAGGEAFDLVLPVAARGEDQDREGLARRAQLANQVETAHARQAEIDHRQVEVELSGLVQRLFGIGHGLDHVATFRQAGLQVMAQQRFIFDDQQFHNTLPDKSESPVTHLWERACSRRLCVSR